ncbi:MAG: hypothetical protein NZ992_03385 [Candidatus Korarchaeum sp.]|nr:hypothetical protein [Candidatus Korarchaeum sp.]MDW8036399.1 hypothetical protein [Candidatus Korarchaeum sp.]
MRSPFYIADKYLIPSLYRLLSVKLRERGMLEVEIARLLRVSTAAVSRYLRLKRGSFRVEETGEATKMVDELVEAIVKGKKISVDEEVHVIASKLMEKKLLCDLHRSVYSSLDPAACRICSRIFR